MIIQAASCLSASIASVISDLTSAGLNPKVKGSEQHYLDGSQVSVATSHKVIKGLLKLNYRLTDKEVSRESKHYWLAKDGNKIYISIENSIAYVTVLS